MAGVQIHLSSGGVREKQNRKFSTLYCMEAMALAHPFVGKYSVNLVGNLFRGFKLNLHFTYFIIYLSDGFREIIEY